MKLLVTGGAGFIGSHLVENLLSRGHQVVCLDDFSTGRKDYIAHLLDNPNLIFVEGSVWDRSLLNRLMEDCEAVFHLAAVLGVKNTVENPLKVIEGNIVGTRNVLELAYPRKLKVVFASTSEIYGKNTKLPFNEESDRVLGPPSTHRWCYATAKALDEHLCFAYGEKGLPVTVVRYFNAYGPRAVASQYGGVIPKFVTAALQGEPITVYGSGDQSRCFTYIEDTIRGTIACLDHRYNNHAFNIGTDHSITINQLAAKIKQLASSSSRIIHMSYEEVYGKGYEDTPNRIPDLTKAKKMLNYQPEVDITTGLKKTIEWYRRQLQKGESR